jgi:hypothetical protein
MGWVDSVMLRPRFTPGERTPGTHCTGGWVGPRAGLDSEGRGKILWPLPGIEHVDSILLQLNIADNRSQTFDAIWINSANLPFSKHNFLKSILGRAMAQVVSRRPLTAEAWVRARVNPCGICGGQSGTGTGFSPSYLVLSCQYIIPPSLSKLISSGECVIC